MIFVTLGSQKFQFNRLLKYIDELIESNEIQEDVFVQKGHSTFITSNYTGKSFLTRDEFISKMVASNMVITHGGTGAIITALKNNKKVIALPRTSKYKEHVDDHQYEIVDAFTETNLILSASNKSELKEALKSIYDVEFNKFVSNNARYIEVIKKIGND